MATLTLRVKGESRSVSVDPYTPRLYVLSNDPGLNGPKYGCVLAQCGACTVLMEGRPVRSCVTPVSAARGPITTIEGLGTIEKLHPLQAAFIAEQACQCGFCGNGMVMSAKALIDRNPRPTEREIKQALNGHLCRCASHNRIVRAVHRAVLEIRPCAPACLAAASSRPAARSSSASASVPTGWWRRAGRRHCRAASTRTACSMRGSGSSRVAA